MVLVLTIPGFGLISTTISVYSNIIKNFSIFNIEYIQAFIFYLIINN